MPKPINVTPAATREVALIKDRIEVQMGRQRSQLERQAVFARDVIAGNPKMSPKDVVRMAESLHRIIAEACRRGRPDGTRLTKAQITDEAGKGDGAGKSGALERFTRDPEKPPKTPGRLNQKPVGYLKLAETAARLAGLDPDRVVVDLVDGTSLAEGMGNLQDAPYLEHLVMLADALQGVARRIDKEIGLRWYFDIIREQGLVPNGDEWDAEHDAEFWQWQTVPQVNLFTEEVAAFLDCIWWPAAPEKESRRAQRKLAWVCRRVGLAFAPFGPGNEVRAYLVRRPVIAITTRPKPFKVGDSIFDNIIFEDAVVVGMPGPEGHSYSSRGTLKVPDPHAVRSVSGCEAWDFPGDDHEFLEVTPANLAAVLESGFSDARDVADDAFHRVDPAFTKSPPGSRAAKLEKALLWGEDADEKRLSLIGILEAKAIRYVVGLRGWVLHRTARIEDALAKMASTGR